MSDEQPDDRTPPAIVSATYSVSEVAALLGVSERHVHRLRDRQTVPGEIRLGRSVRFARRVVDRWLDDGRRPAR